MDLFGLQDVTKKPVFYRGVIEDNNDPEKLGRLKVRIFGIHSDSNEDLSTQSLPWAEVATPMAFGFMSGIGVSSVPVKGTYVWCFLDDGNEDKPVIFATCPGVSTEKEEGSFTDPDKVYPIEKRLNESDYNRLARNEKVDETESEKLLKQNRIIGTPTSTGGTWDEPESLNSKAKYPTNNVIETPSYNVIQIDDTSGNERIQVFHRSGTYLEIRPDGSLIVHSVKDRFDLVNENHNSRIKGSENNTVDVDHNELIGNTETITVRQKVTHNYNNAFDLNVSADEKHAVQGSCNYTVSGKHVITGNKIFLN